MSSLRAPWQNETHKKQTQRTTQKHVEHQYATDIQKTTNYFSVFFRNSTVHTNVVYVAVLMF